MAQQAWIISTFAGTGERGFSGDGGPAIAARLNGPFDLGFDGAGNLYFSDTFNHRIRRIDARSAVIATLAGNGMAGYSGDGGPATEASFNEPYGVAVDRHGRIWVSSLTDRVQCFTPEGKYRYGIAGSGDESGQFIHPHGMAFDSKGFLYVADAGNQRIQKFAVPEP